MCLFYIDLKLLEMTTFFAIFGEEKAIVRLRFTLRNLAATLAHLNLLDSVHFIHLPGPLLFLHVLPADDREDMTECSCSQDINIHHALVYFSKL